MWVEIRIQAIQIGIKFILVKKKKFSTRTFNLANGISINFNVSNMTVSSYNNIPGMTSLFDA